MSVAQMGQATELARGYVWRVENGKVNPNLTTLARFAIALETSLSDLLSGINVDAAAVGKRSFAWQNPEGKDPRPKRGAGSPTSSDG
jgi:transcriptional regulator with XRE-family HTH domain